jgi:hypothetical protein
VGHRGSISRTRRQEIAGEARRISALARAEGVLVDEIQETLLRAFPGELGAGEARMHAEGWTVGVIREGLQALATKRGLEASRLQDADIWRWLRGEMCPRSDSLERLCRLFRCHQAQLGWPPRGNEIPISFGRAATTRSMALLGAETPSSLAGVRAGPADAESPPDREQRDWATWFGVKLSHLLALTDRCLGGTPRESLQQLVHQEVLMFDAVRPGPSADHSFEPSRRQMLIALLTLPVALAPSVRLGEASSPLVEKVLSQCAASITAAYHLLKETDFAIVEQQVSGYLLALTALARQPSPHQSEAARLASLAYRALGIVGLHRRQFGAVEYYFRQGLLYADIADDPHMSTLALSSTSIIRLIYFHDPSRADEVHQRALQYEQSVTPSERSRLSASLALTSAMKGAEQESLRHMHDAEERYPAHPETEPNFLYAEFNPGNRVLYRGLTQLALARAFPEKGYQQQAWDTFEQVRQLAVKGAVTERVRVEIVNHQAATALEMRDLERFITRLAEGVQGAQSLQSAQRLHEASTAWRQSLQVWPAEPRVAALEELFTDSPGRISSGQQ